MEENVAKKSLKKGPLHTHTHTSLLGLQLPYMDILEYKYVEKFWPSRKHNYYYDKFIEQRFCRNFLPAQKFQPMSKNFFGS